MVQADLVDEHALGLDAQESCRLTLAVDRDVAEPDGAVPGVEERPRDDAHRIGEVDDPCIVRGPLADALRDSEHDGNGPQCLGETAHTRGLLPDAAARQRKCLVGEARLLPADPDLHEHEVGSVDRAVEIVGDGHGAVEALTGEHPRGEAAYDLPSLLVDVVEHELPHVDALALAGQPGDEFRRVRGAASDDRDLQGHQPFTPVSVTPSTNAL
jgi:hypothetical protein